MLNYQRVEPLWARFYFGDAMSFLKRGSRSEKSWPCPEPRIPGWLHTKKIGFCIKLRFFWFYSFCATVYYPKSTQRRAEEHALGIVMKKVPKNFWYNVYELILLYRPNYVKLNRCLLVIKHGQMHIHHWVLMNCSMMFEDTHGTPVEITPTECNT